MKFDNYCIKLKSSLSDKHINGVKKVYLDDNTYFFVGEDDKVTFFIHENNVLYVEME